MDKREELNNELQNINDYDTYEEMCRDEQNYKETLYDDSYEFDGCPTIYECLKNSKRLCDGIVKKLRYNEKQEMCMECWKQALCE